MRGTWDGYSTTTIMGISINMWNNLVVHGCCRTKSMATWSALTSHRKIHTRNLAFKAKVSRMEISLNTRLCWTAQCLRSALRVVLDTAMVLLSINLVDLAQLRIADSAVGR